MTTRKQAKDRGKEPITRQELSAAFHEIAVKWINKEHIKEHFIISDILRDLRDAVK